MRFNTGPGTRTPKERNKRRRPLPGGRSAEHEGLLGGMFDETFSDDRRSALLRVQGMTMKDILEEYARLTLAHVMAAEKVHRDHELEMPLTELNKVINQSGALLLRLVKAQRDLFQVREMDAITAKIDIGDYEVETDEDGNVTTTPMVDA